MTWHCARSVSLWPRLRCTNGRSTVLRPRVDALLGPPTRWLSLFPGPAIFLPYGSSVNELAQTLLLIPPLFHRLSSDPHHCHEPNWSNEKECGPVVGDDMRCNSSGAMRTNVAPLLEMACNAIALEPVSRPRYAMYSKPIRVSHFDPAAAWGLGIWPSISDNQE